MKESDVTEQLRSYATRGVFREFSVTALPAQRIEYRFVWLTSKPIRAIFDARSAVLAFPALLPGIEPRSPMRRALDEFLKARFSTKLPPHRRMSKAMIRELKSVVREGNMTLRLTLDRKRLTESTKQAVQLLSELFQGFLAGSYHEYMVRNFDIPED